MKWQLTKTPGSIHNSQCKELLQYPQPGSSLYNVSVDHWSITDYHPVVDLVDLTFRVGDRAVSYLEHDTGWVKISQFDQIMWVFS